MEAHKQWGGSHPRPLVGARRKREQFAIRLLDPDSACDRIKRQTFNYNVLTNPVFVVQNIFIIKTNTQLKGVFFSLNTFCLSIFSANSYKSMLS